MQRSSVNKVILVGHMGNKPEGRYTPSGVSTASFSIATNESWINSESKKQERTEWHNIIAWNKLADFATEYLQKGQLVYIEGRMQTRSYKDKENIQRKITEIISSAITPLEWKDHSKKGDAIASNDSEDSQDGNAQSTEQDLPF